jgi:hypothetical protein
MLRAAAIRQLHSHRCCLPAPEYKRATLSSSIIWTTMAPMQGWGVTLVGGDPCGKWCTMPALCMPAPGPAITHMRAPKDSCPSPGMEFWWPLDPPLSAFTDQPPAQSLAVRGLRCTKRPDQLLFIRCQRNAITLLVMYFTCTPQLTSAVGDITVPRLLTSSEKWAAVATEVVHTLAAHQQLRASQRRTC